MERSTSPLTYKGSISAAISEAQKQKKLLMVYISGEDENSINLEQSTWVELTVAEAIPKYCIFLHLMQGSVGASQFSDIYPHKSIPSISAVGYNGLLLWKHEGYISAENLVVSIEKAWLTLHLQETTASLLSATLASKPPEPLGSSSRSVAPVEEVVSSITDFPSTSGEKPTEGPEDGLLAEPKQLVEQKVREDDPKFSNPGEGTCSQSGHVDDIMIDREKQSNSAGTTTEVLNPASRVVCSETSDDRDLSITPQDKGTCSQSGHVDDIMIDREKQSNSASTTTEVLNPASRDVCSETSDDRDLSITPQVNLSLDGEQTTTKGSAERNVTTSSQGITRTTGNKVEKRSRVQKVDVPIDLSNAIKTNAIKTNDVHLNIRLPDGDSLQPKFTVTDTLRSVKNYVDENQTSGIGSYDLAVPYPRKVFSEQEMNCALSELGFASRQALIVVPHRGSTGRPLPSNPDYSSNNTTGYFGHVRRIISYVNPFSYISGGNASSSSRPESAAPAGSNSWQYGPDPAPQNQFSEESSRQGFLENQNPSGVSTVRRRTSRGVFGGNIHTLRRDEDEDRSKDRNTFWNGNSTEYGGNDR